MRNPDCHMNTELLTLGCCPVGPGPPQLCTLGAMGGSPSWTLTALLCLGLCRGLWDQVQAGTLPKPSIWAEPGAMVPKGSRMTLWCEGSVQAGGLRLYKGNVSVDWENDVLQESSNKTGFVFEPVASHYGGLYQCGPLNCNSSSELSEPLTLVVTGAFPPPSLSAHPSPVVEAGGRVTLSCSSETALGTFHLLKEGGADPPLHMEQRPSPGRPQVLFPVGPVNASHGGTYRCYGSSSSYPQQWSEPSDPLHLEVTGVLEAPTLVAQPGQLVLTGDSLTLQCRSQAGFNTFSLTRDEGPQSPEQLDGQHSPDFPLGPVNSSHGGRYRCLGRHSLAHVWSAPSEPLDLLVAGAHRRPTLSALPGPRVPWRGDVTLQCRSDTPADTFRLSKEGSPAPPQLLQLRDSAAPSQANFTFSAVTQAQGGSYRCYSSLSSAPHLLSLPSAPLQLLVSAQGHRWDLSLLIGVSGALVLLLSLLLFLLLRRRCRGAHRKTDAAATGTQPEEGAQLDPQQSRNYEDAQDVTYAQVNHSRPRGTAARPPAAGAGDSLSTVGRHSAGKQDAPDACQDVTYVQLNHGVLRGERAAPSSTPESSSEYAALARR
ncbi:leukocyte immunoglobulin-like receptor subfamily A member 3 isoform X1 [Erinaceus europaeus]|uniref:Leukocyte immunoglobulin-like receptor subfamily A member 3 isoform X1 n=1 Tax=Erinaceus europaeus TaxID=9365 RepID=A0ABM3VXH3_ERIEU|nr:leukocyte immunoglobulin-like receptor subfamily A member 3 isoform X1 [Erinaceus europaeus]